MSSPQPGLRPESCEDEWDQATEGEMLVIEGITKTYAPPRGLLRWLIRSAASEPVQALRGVSFQVAAGEVVGLVGPNGAGKTTLIRILATLLSPTSGTATVAGYDVTAAPVEAQRRLGLVLSDDRGLYWRLTGRQNLEYFGVMAGLAPAVARQRAGELLETFDLAGLDKLVFGYSAGMRSRLNLAQALLADPAVLILDEPTVSLDPLASARIGRHLRDLASRGRTILLSSHRLDEVAEFCDRVVVLIEGTVRFDGAPAALAHGQEPAARALGEFLARETGT